MPPRSRKATPEGGRVAAGAASKKTTVKNVRRATWPVVVAVAVAVAGLAAWLAFSGPGRGSEGHESEQISAVFGPLSIKDEEPAVTVLLNHGRRLGAKLHVYGRHFDATGGRGLAAAKDFKAGDVVMKVPVIDEAMIGAHNLPKEFRKRLKKGKLESTPFQKLVFAFGLLYERQRPESPWQSFFETLPRRIESMAVMDEVHRRALSGTDLSVKLGAFDELLARMRKSLEDVRSYFASPPTDEDLRWAIAVAESRTHARGNGEALIIWPYVALGNHHWDVGETLESVAVDGTVRLRARRAIAAGEQVFLHYGHFANIRLLVQYGFTIPGNPLLNTVSTAFFTPFSTVLLKFHRSASERLAQGLGPKGPPCGDIAADMVGELRRWTHQPAALPELLLSCWRKSQFADVASARTAADAGMFDLAGEEAHLRPGAREKLEVAWLERDARALEAMAAACQQAQDELRPEGGGALQELARREDPLSARMHEAILVEIRGWDQCIAEMGRRAASTRAALV